MAGCDAEFVQKKCMVRTDSGDGEFDRRVLEGVDFRLLILLFVPRLWFLGQSRGVADLELERYEVSTNSGSLVRAEE